MKPRTQDRRILFREVKQKQKSNAKKKKQEAKGKKKQSNKEKAKKQRSREASSNKAKSKTGPGLQRRGQKRARRQHALHSSCVRAHTHTHETKGLSSCPPQGSGIPIFDLKQVILRRTGMKRTKLNEQRGTERNATIKDFNHLLNNKASILMTPPQSSQHALLLFELQY